MSSKKKWLSLALGVTLMATMLPQAYGAQAQPEVRNLAKGLKYEWSEAPHSNYPDPSGKLTDGVIGSANVTDPSWVGSLNKQTREIVFDLGEAKSISKIRAHFLQDWPGSAVLFPLTVSMYVSDDKQNWGTVAHKATEHLWTDGPPVDQFYTWDGSKDGIPNAGSDAKMAYARYVKVAFSMHPKAWEFIDEIEIWGADGKIEGAKQVPAEAFDYMQPGENTAGIRNLSLLYNGYYSDGVKMTKEKLVPEIGYVNKEGKPVDWFFDGALVLGLQSPQGRDFGEGGALLTDWKWYLDKTFADQGDLEQLNEATKEVGQKLGQPGHKTKTVMMIPNPGEYTTDFGDIDGDGVTENFNEGAVGKDKAIANRQKVIRWWIDEVSRKFEEKHYSNLELSGYYWLQEQVGTSSSGPDLLRFTNGLVHEKGLKSFWIPHFLAYKSYMWKDVGFDAVTFQPNYYFEPLNIDRLQDAAETAKRFGMGVELEFDDRLLTDAVFRKRFLEYLDAGEQFGFKGNSFKAYYKGSGPVMAQSAASSDPEIRGVYDKLYEFTKNGPAAGGAPVASDSALSTAPDTPVSGALQATDDDGDALTYSIVRNGAKGNAQVTDASKGTFTYTPGKGQTGTDTFTFKASDGKTDSNVATVTVTIAAGQTGWQTVLTGSGTVPAGEKFSVTYGLTGGSQAVYAQDLKVEYDAAFMDFVSAKPVMDGISLLETDKKTPGQLRLLMASQGDSHAVTGPAKLLELTFRSKKDNQTIKGVVSVTSAVMGDREGKEAEAAPSSLTVQTPGSVPGDYNGDGKVSVGDLAIVAAPYGKTKQSPDWEQVKHLDIKKDGKIDNQDLSAVASKILK
ncbi:DUF4855 domain-containing protein [Paenibacillus sp. RC84]|uniref:DUF4855 domain-containing protein n=1 Tax=Paenibacillus sp. RC84 TaxID=3156252 RepID=UPI00351605A0